jgi:hypothetical protein
VRDHAPIVDEVMRLCFLVSVQAYHLIRTQLLARQLPGPRCSGRGGLRWQCKHGLRRRTRRHRRRDQARERRRQLLVLPGPLQGCRRRQHRARRQDLRRCARRVLRTGPHLRTAIALCHTLRSHSRCQSRAPCAAGGAFRGAECGSGGVEISICSAEGVKDRGQQGNLVVGRQSFQSRLIFLHCLLGRLQLAVAVLRIGGTCSVASDGL